MAMIISYVPDEEVEFIKTHKNPFGWRSTKDCITNAIRNGTVLPDNATNGEVLRALFKNVKPQDMVWDWWNSPYKEGDTE